MWNGDTMKEAKFYADAFMGFIRDKFGTDGKLTRGDVLLGIVSAIIFGSIAIVMLVMIVIAMSCMFGLLAAIVLDWNTVIPVANMFTFDYQVVGIAIFIGIVMIFYLCQDIPEYILEKIVSPIEDFFNKEI